MDKLEDIEHVHEKDTDFVNNPSKNYKWSDEASKIVAQGVKNNAKPTRIYKILKESHVLAENLPTKLQLYNKIAAEKKKNGSNEKVTTTHELRQKISQFLNEPIDEFESFVAFNEIDDIDPSKEPRFTIIVTSKMNLKKLGHKRVLQTEATYRLNWFGFPVFVIGKCHHIIDNFVRIFLDTVI